MGALSIGGINIQVPDNITIGSGGDITLPTKIGSPGGGSNNAHIPAQNQAVAELGYDVEQYNNLKAQNQNTLANVQQLVNQVNGSVSRFAQVVNQANTARARQGYTDVRRLADQVIASFTTTTGQSINPTMNNTGGIGATPSIISGVSNSTLLLAAGAGLLLLSRK